MNITFRLNLEQQKTRAKELLKSFKQNDAEAINRFKSHHPKLTYKEVSTPEFKACLADAQLVVARELGCTTWVKLKSHIILMTSLRERIQSNSSITDEPDHCLHIRCGSDIQKTISEAGFKGDFMEFSDPFCVGPKSYDYHAEKRAEFLHNCYGKQAGMTYTECSKKIDDSYQMFRTSAQKYSHVVLWFEHDPYDQLILMFLLSQYHRFGLPKNLRIVTTDKFPGTIRFRGLGQLPPEAMRLLWESRQLVTPEQCLEADQHWKAFTNPDREHFHKYIETLSNSSFPYFRSAAIRQLQEQPLDASQLSLTQKITIEMLADQSPQKAGQLFKKLTEKEDPLPFLGDQMYWHILREMNDSGLLHFNNEPERWLDTLITLK